MKKQIQCNKGFSLLELLIAMTIFAIISVMLVTFMSSTTAAYRKTQQNIQVQTEAMQVQEQMSDVLMQADYIRIEVGSDCDVYSLAADTTKKGDEARKFDSLSAKTVDDIYNVKSPNKTDEEFQENRYKVGKALKVYSDAKGSSMSLSFVPDNYANYLTSGANNRKAIIDYSNFRLISNIGQLYPITGDLDSAYATDDANPIHSFQMLKPADDGIYYYVKPKYIYVEYKTKDASDNLEKMHAIYCIDNENIYTTRYSDATSTDGFEHAKSLVDALVTAGDTQGKLTGLVEDYYISADAYGNSLIVNAMFKNQNYEYNARNVVKFRNSNVLTVRPQDMYKKVDHSITPITPGAPASTEASTEAPTTEAP